MKTNVKPVKKMTITSFVPLCLMIVFSLLMFNVNGQSSNSVNPVDEYVQKNTDSPLVKFYLADTSNKLAMRAIKNATLLASPEKEKMSEEQIAELNRPIENVLVLEKEASLLVAEGMNYERAVRTTNAKKSQDRETRQNSERSKTNDTKANDNSVPTLIIK